MPALKSGTERWVIGVALLLAALAPLALTGYAKTFMTTILLYVAMAQAWNLFSGLTGYVSFGHSLFFGAGAYTFALAQVKGGLPWWLCLALSGVVAAVVAVLVGALVLRRRMGIGYFSVLMLGLNEIMLTVVSNAKPLGASYGITLKSMPSQWYAYYGIWAVAVAVSAAVMWLNASHFGLALKALRVDEQAADLAGVNSFAVKVATLAGSAGALGMLGGLVAWNWRYIDPFLGFDVLLTFKMVLMAYLGGVGTALGPVIGATVMTVLDELLSVHASGVHTILIGLFMVVVVVRMPGGLVDLGRYLKSAVRRVRNAVAGNGGVAGG